MSSPDNAVAPCPYCGADVWVSEEVEAGVTIVCDVCSTPLQVIEVQPLMLDFAWEGEWEEDDENWEDEEEFAYLDDDLEMDDWDGDSGDDA